MNSRRQTRLRRWQPPIKPPPIWTDDLIPVNFTEIATRYSPAISRYSSDQTWRTLNEQIALPFHISKSIVYQWPSRVPMRPATMIIQTRWKIDIRQRHLGCVVTSAYNTDIIQPNSSVVRHGAQFSIDKGLIIRSGVMEYHNVAMRHCSVAFAYLFKHLWIPCQRPIASSSVQIAISVFVSTSRRYAGVLLLLNAAA